MKTRIFLTAALMLCSLSGCGGTASQSPAEHTEGSSAPETVTAETSLFDKYVSNTFISTGCNQVVHAPEGMSYRAYLPVEAAGEFEYCFYFSNAVDSTWGNGKDAHVGQAGSAYQINSAFIGYAAEPEGEVQQETPVTFEGAAQRTVTPEETFWSDPVQFNVPEGNYLVWTWTVTGETIPANEMSGLAPVYYDNNGNYIYTGQIPLPQLIGCDRAVERKVAFIGDSITQGCGTSQYGNAFWVADIAKEISDTASVWNLGLGYARASDCMQNGDWLQRATHADVVFVAFGTNDMVSGQYGVGAPNAASAIDIWLKDIAGVLKDAGCEVILFNAPPFDFAELQEGFRTELNTMVPGSAQECGVRFFDFAGILEDPANPQHALYGGHPDDEGCAAAARAILAEYGTLLRKAEGAA
ncbi:MAG: SGNH/GDSL hydrolase family protein [Oscillospiraceae bacterium]|nr:SGNH/GDSL hydrolase family protein [Oscillospiraceae bacterium]